MSRAMSRAVRDAFRFPPRVSFAALLSGVLLLLPVALHAAPTRAQEPTTVVIQESAPIVVKDAPPAVLTPDANKRGAHDDGEGAATRDALAGRVTGPDGQPLAGVAVFAGVRNSANASRPPNTTRTGEDGKFSFAGLEHGVYFLNASAPGYVTEANPQTSPDSNYHRPGDFVDIRMIKGGVITGTVTAENGDPVVAAPVHALLVRKADGTPSPNDAAASSYVERMTDDRGVYRIYGLRPGSYIVAAGGRTQFGSALPGAYDGDVPTYFPATMRDAATEIAVRSGQEATGIDIHYRAERGHTISGQLTLPDAAPDAETSGVQVTLSHAASGAGIATTWTSGREGERSFILDGLGDGDYDLRASQQTRTGTASISTPQRVSVRGADVTGLKLTLAPVASVSGSLIIELLPAAERAKTSCGERASLLLPQETLVIVRRDAPPTLKDQPRANPLRRFETTPGAAGGFTRSGLEAGRYRIEARPLGDNFYLRAVELPAATQTPVKPGATTPRTPPAIAAAAAQQPGTLQTHASNTHAPNTHAPLNEALDLKSGQQLAGVVVHVAEGAASVSGSVAPEGEGTTLPPAASLRVHLVPADRAQMEDPLRFAEATPDKGGTYTFKQLAPGRYLFLVRAAPPPGDETPGTPPRPAAWDSAGRARLRREAEAANITLELQPCRQRSDFALRYPPAARK